MTPKNKLGQGKSAKPTLGHDATHNPESNFDNHSKLQFKSNISTQNILTRQYSNSEVCQIMSKILNISQEKIVQNIDLFGNIDHYVFNSLYYLSKLNSKENRIHAVHSLEFICNFNKGIDRDLT